MNKFKQFIKNLWQSLYVAIKRFPHAITFAALAGTVFIILNHINANVDVERELARLALSFLFAIPLCLTAQMVIEMKSPAARIWNFIPWIAGVVGLGSSFYLILLDIEQQVYVVRYIALILSFTVLFSFVTFMRERQYPEVYARKLGWRLAIAWIYNWIIVGGIEAILFAIENLLGLNISEKIYLDVLILIPSFFMPAFFFAGIPDLKDKLGEGMPKLFKVLLLYVLMPLLTAYTAVLYAYFVKLLIDWQWPINMLGNLVLWYGLISALVLYLTNPVKGDNAWSQFFYKWYPYVLILPVLMMFASFGIRINAYGLTEPRYFALAAGIWVLICASTFILKGRLGKIKWIPISLSLIALLSVLGPWSAFSLSKLSQNRRFEQILKKNDMLKHGRIMPSQKLTKAEQQTLSSILDYFDENHSLENVRHLPDGFTLENSKAVLGFEYQLGYESDVRSVFSKEEPNVIDTRDYDYYIPICMKRADADTPPMDKEALQAYCDDENTLIIEQEGVIIYQLDMGQVATKILEENSDESPLSQEELTVKDSNENVNIKILIRHINYYDNQFYIDFSVLIKLE